MSVVTRGHTCRCLLTINKHQSHVFYFLASALGQIYPLGEEQIFFPPFHLIFSSLRCKIWDRLGDRFVNSCLNQSVNSYRYKVIFFTSCTNLEVCRNIRIIIIASEWRVLVTACVPIGRQLRSHRAVVIHLFLRCGAGTVLWISMIHGKYLCAYQEKCHYIVMQAALSLGKELMHIRPRM